MGSNTAKNFALQLGSLIALYVSLGAIIALLFGTINVAFPDAAAGRYEHESAQNGIRFGVAMLVVFFPTYLVLTRLVNRTRRREGGVYLTLTKWLIYLSLLVGGGIILGDLVAVILAYLNGEITTRFILKALVLLVIIGAAFTYYLLDARGYWQREEQKSVFYGIGASVLVIAALVLGFSYSDSPSEIRERKLDDEQVRDLQDMQWRIEEHYRIEGSLPETIEELYVGIPVPEAPENRPEYAYRTLSGTSFELCATFVKSSMQETPSHMRPIAPEGEFLKNPYNWDHGSGRVCFERIIQENLR